MRFGVHVSIAGGIWNAPARADALGCETFQIFVTNPRGWRLAPLEDEAAARFREARRASGLAPVVAHLSYLPNLATRDREIGRRSDEHLLEEYRRAARLGAELFVCHPGSAGDGRNGPAVERLARRIGRLFEREAEGPLLCLETMSGGGGMLGGEPEELAAVAERLRAPDRLGVCVDTAHLLAAGHPIQEEGGMAAYRRRLLDAFGTDPVRVLHVNDLRSAPGSRHDRHEHIGAGAIGEAGFRRILHTPGLRRLPVILETPVERDGDDERNLARARALVASAETSE